MRQRVELERIDGRTRVRVGGRRFLLDTGCATSFGAAPLELFGDRIDLPALGPGGWDVARLQRALGAEVEGLLGSDLLSAVVVLLDLPAGFALFSGVPLTLGEATLPLELVDGVPVVDVQIAGRTERARLHSGGKYSYLDPERLVAAERVGRGVDFFAGEEPFESELFAASVALDELELDGPFAVAPPAQLQAWRTHSIHAALGSEWLAAGPCLLDLGAGRLGFAGD